MVNIEIDEGSGFCFGVTTAIRKAEEELAKGNTLYCLGDIVHNGQECESTTKSLPNYTMPKYCYVHMENLLKHTL